MGEWKRNGWVMEPFFSLRPALLFDREKALTLSGHAAPVKRLVGLQYNNRPVLSANLLFFSRDCGYLG